VARSANGPGPPNGWPAATLTRAPEGESPGAKEIAAEPSGAVAPGSRERSDPPAGGAEHERRLEASLPDGPGPGPGGRQLHGTEDGKRRAHLPAGGPRRASSAKEVSPPGDDA
jgi:hypothetical protein